MIKPTLGRVVWFTPGTNDVGPIRDGDGRCAALVVNVWTDRLVNLAVFDANGVHWPRNSVPLLQDQDPRPPGGYYAEWMPYQLSKAKEEGSA